MWKSLFGRKSSGPQVGGGKELLTLTVSVDADAETAFRVFVDELGSWWPADYTWSKEKLQSIGIEPVMGGKCFETDADGERKVWGTVLTMSRPKHIVFAWQIGPDQSPEENEATASRVDIRFSPADEGGCHVLLVHRDFFRHGEGWEAYRQQMAGDKGWPLLIQRYQAAIAGE